MKKLILLLIIVGIIISCKEKTNRITDANYVRNPTTLKELFSGFNEDEINADVYDFKRDSVVIVATGHLYPLLYHPDVYRAFIKTIKAQHPDYFFTLGDNVYNNTEKEWDTVLSHFNELQVPVYYAPGNHDLNFHYERYAGKRDHQVQAEKRYLAKAKCRYKLVKDNLANYVFINANDSAKRVLSFLSFIRPQLDTTKHLIMFSSPSLWFEKHQDPNDPKTWPNRPFRREKLLPKIKDFEYLIHGDWSGKFARFNFLGFNVMAVGNRKEGDTLYITRITIYKDTIIAKPIFVPMPDGNTWFKHKSRKKKK
ncbi:MAG: hypothetical protein DRJ09_10035 [Bacteroidetes bacterium]|nr:MAG: hypothetical protein DRJ09_10035 [Bacteroidota bacterium]